jgi:recombination protein RecA
MPKIVSFEGMSTGKTQKNHAYFPSSLVSLNKAIGDLRGIQGGSLVQLLAEPGHGKTTLALDYIAQAQKTGIKDVTISLSPRESTTINAVFVDLERTFDAAYAEKLGVDLAKLAVYKPDFAEQALPVLEHLLEQGLQVIVFDSVPAMITKDEFNKDVDEPARMAGSANLLSRWLVRIIGLVDNADAVVFFINQYRANISPMARSEKKPFGPRALKYYSKIILELVKIKTEDTRSTIQLTVTKNKQSADGARIEYYMRKGSGVSGTLDVFALAVDAGLITKSGSWYEYAGVKAQGVESAAELFNMTEIRTLVEKELANESFRS